MKTGKKKRSYWMWKTSFTTKGRRKKKKNRLRGKIIQMVERADRDRKDNLTEKERRGMRDISIRKDIVIQAADKGGAIVVMEKDWYKDKMKEQITEEYGIIGKNTRQERNKLISKIKKSNEEGYGKKRLRNRRKSI